MNKPAPPRLALRLLAWFCPDHLYEEIEGDLIQRLHRDLKQHNEQKARRRFVWNAIRFFRPGILMRNKFSLNPPTFMISNYFKVASRVMLRNKSYSAINIAGLTLGITGAILLFLWVGKEFSYDQFHADSDRVFQAWNREKQASDVSCWSTTPRVLAPTLKAEYPSVENAASFGAYGSSQLFTAGNTRIVKQSGAYTDPDFLKIFSFPMLKGDRAHALENPNSIVVTEKLARDLFGDKEAFGETITLNESGYAFPFTITGVLKELPSNTDFHFEYLISYQFLESLGEKDTYWGNNSVSTYVKLQKGESIDDFNEKIRTIAQKHSKEESDVEVFLYPFARMHLYSGFQNGIQSGGRIEIIRMLAILGGCLIVVACINFINLSTARAQKRSREVGIRKVTGAVRRSLVVQFLCESIMIAAVAGVISLAAAYVVLPSFSSLVHQQLDMDFGNLSFWMIVLAGIVVIGIIAGGYPAFYLSSFQPVRVLKGAIISPGSRGRLRQLLVVFQFGFAVTLIVSVIVISKQIRFVQDREIGYSKDNLIFHAVNGDLEKNFNAYKNDLVASGVVVSVTRSSSPMTDRMSSTSGIQWRAKDPQDKTLIERFYFDGNISETAGVSILEGRDIDLEKFPTDASAVLLNETAVKLMGFKEPIGETLNDDGKELHVVGVVRDFILTTPYEKIEPMVFYGSTQWCHFVNIRLNPASPVRKSIETIRTIFSRHNATFPFDYRFVDDEYQAKFSSLETTLTISTIFGSMTIFIACLGLLGLSSFMIESRMKEIGIRKVMGGSVVSVLKLLSFKMLRPILIGIILFSPMAWLSMSWWLRSFDYRITMSVWIVALSGISIIGIAVLTIAIQTFNAANMNPVKTLRTE